MCIVTYEMESKKIFLLFFLEERILLFCVLFRFRQSLRLYFFLLHCDVFVAFFSFELWINSERMRIGCAWKVKCHTNIYMSHFIDIDVGIFTLPLFSHVKIFILSVRAGFHDANHSQIKVYFYMHILYPFWIS